MNHLGILQTQIACFHWFIDLRFLASTHKDGQNDQLMDKKQT